MTKYIFIGGLHRSGTSLLARMIAQHPEVASIERSPAPENEGCYLQGAIPFTALDGMPMHFATDPKQHYDEHSQFNTNMVKQRIEQDWQQWFKSEKSYRLEKSPVNMLRFRLYQQLFPMSKAIVIIRHPEAVAAASAKWVNHMNFSEMVDHWIDAHAKLLLDINYLHNFIIIRYEDLIEKTDFMLKVLFEYLELDSCNNNITIDQNNDKYCNEFSMSDVQRKLVKCYGYNSNLQVYKHSLIIRHPYRSVCKSLTKSYDKIFN